MQKGLPGGGSNVGEQIVSGQHRLIIADREQVEVEGVLHVESFDDREITLGTILGTLTLRGEDLNIRQLDLESGCFAVTGMIHGVQYSSAERGKGRGQGFWQKLLK